MCRPLALLVLAVHVAAAAETWPLPGMPDSLRIPPEDPQLDERAFVGKVALIVFCQDQDAKKNVLNYDLFDQLTEAFAHDDRLILLAVKTDGGSAAKYVGARCDRSRWVVADDPNGRWFAGVVPDGGELRYAVVDPGRRVVETGDALAHKRLPKGRSFHLAKKDLVGTWGADASQVLPEGKGYGAELAEAVRRAEHRDFRGAIAAVKEHHDAKMADEFIADIAALMDGEVASLARRLAVLDERDRDASTARLYPDFRSLAAIAEELEGTEVGAEAAKLAKRHRRHFKHEIAAEKAFRNLEAQLAEADEEDQLRGAAKAYAAIAKRYPDTRYGGTARAEAEHWQAKMKAAAEEAEGVAPRRSRRR